MTEHKKLKLKLSKKNELCNVADALKYILCPDGEESELKSDFKDEDDDPEKSTPLQNLDEELSPQPSPMHNVEVQDLSESNDENCKTGETMRTSKPCSWRLTENESPTNISWKEPPIP